MNKTEIKTFVENFMKSYEEGTFEKDENGRYMATMGASSINLVPFFEDLVEETCNACQEADKWVPVTYGLVPCNESGEWDGKRSPQLLLWSRGEMFTGRAYEGTMDGSYYLDFYDDNDLEINGVTHFQLPNPPKI